MTDIQSVEDTTRELLAILPLLGRIVTAEVHAELGEEVTVTQFRALAYLAERPRTLSALARYRRVSVQAMGELVQALVERGWVQRTPDSQDRRQHLLELTNEGRLHYERAHCHMLQHLKPLLAELDAAELDAVRVALPALRRVLCRSTEERCGG